jgi:hypothetical protein
MKSTHRIRAALTAAALALFASQADAQATRTWVSGVGDDVNPCSRTAPCKTFAGAISKTATGGEISVLDPGGYGAVTITKSMTISGDGTLASILGSGTNGVVVNCLDPVNANCVVTLRNISINGGATGFDGIRYVKGGELHVDNVTIYNFTGEGIKVIPTVNAQNRLFVSNSKISNNTAGGILVQPTGSAVVNGSITNTLLDGNGRGLRVENSARVQVRDSQATGNDANGFVALNFATIALENCVASNNLATGVYAGSSASVRMSSTMVLNNLNGLQAVGGTIISFGNNRVYANSAGDGAPTSTLPQM